MLRIAWSRCCTLARSTQAWRIVAALAALLLVGVGTLGLVAAQADPRVVSFNVDSLLDEPDAAPGDGACASTPSGLCTLRAAIQEANALTGDDTITLPAGTYTLTLSGSDNNGATGDLDITASVTIQGAGAASTVVDANSLDRAFQILDPAVVTMTHLTIQGGDSAATSGGGIAVGTGSQLTLEDVTVSGNTAGDAGGGIYNNGGTLTLTRVRVLDNQALTAAGIRNSGSLALYDSSVAGNHATQTGGGILNTGALTLERVTISGNVADTNGGGLYLHSADPATGLVTIQNSTISGNQAKSFMGGGIWIYYQTELSMTNCTVANNSAGQGGGIFNYHQQAARVSLVQAGNIQLFNTVVANNALANCGRSDQTEPIYSRGHNLDSGTTCEFAGTGDLVNTNPQLGLLQDNGGPTWTHALLPGSPAIDGGGDTGCPTTDQRGVSRPQGDHCDIGAYETIPSGEANLVLAKVDDPDPVAPGATLAYTLQVANTGPNEATSVEVVDTLPAGVEFADAAGSGWSCGHAGGEVTCTRPSLALDAAPDIVIHVLAPASAGTITNTAAVTSAVADPSPGNNLAEEPTQVEAPPVEQADLSITKTGNPDPVAPGATLTYTLQVANAGPDTTTTITVTDPLPPEVIFVQASGAGWSCGHAGGEVTCTKHSLTVGTEPDIAIWVTAPSQRTTLSNTAVVSSQVADPNLSNNSVTITTQVSLFHTVYLPLVHR